MLDGTYRFTDGHLAAIVQMYEMMPSPSGTMRGGPVAFAEKPGVARRRAGSAGEGLGAEAAPRHEDGQGEISS